MTFTTYILTSEGMIIDLFWSRPLPKTKVVNAWTGPQLDFYQDIKLHINYLSI